jgi:hypothetical protein
MKLDADSVPGPPRPAGVQQRWSPRPGPRRSFVPDSGGNARTPNLTIRLGTAERRSESFDEGSVPFAGALRAPRFQLPRQWEGCGTSRRDERDLRASGELPRKDAR